MALSSVKGWLTNRTSVIVRDRAIVAVSVRRFKNETQENNVAPRTNIEDIITDECISAIQQGVTSFTIIREMIKKRIELLPEEERLRAEQRLSLMIDQDKARPHEIVRH